nr:adenylate/guanylate cyclase domain-containing protein [Sneathiella limimaris]
MILILSVILAFFIGRKIARPIKSLSRASQQISNLDFQKVGNLPSSRLRELDDAATAYNTMLRGLTWFENYVPKSLVKKLMSSGDAHSETRSVSVMFTDIVNFTPMAENMSSEEVANLLNEHFEILANCIEQEDGTLDKYIGDAVMAFWGAPDYQIDHPLKACRTAICIRTAIRAENQRRVKAGKPPIQMRIGIHTGRLVVGNIGAPGRLNYTVVGDTVNVAQRIEQLGKTLNDDKDEDVLILLSDKIASEVQDQINVEPVGEFNVKGRGTKISIYRLAEQ